MYIVIDKEFTGVPSIMRKPKRHSNLIKVEELKQYYTAQSLVEGVDNQIESLQEALEEQVAYIVNEKEEVLNEQVLALFENAQSEQALIQDEWSERAYEAINNLIQEERKQINEFKEELRELILNRVRLCLHSLSDNEDFILFLINILKNEFNDIDEIQSVDIKSEGKNSILTIMNDNKILTIDTSDVVSKLVESLGNLNEV
ncbi:hypothetical protein EJ063_07615 [Vibrio aquaticus]|uniref:Flagellar assembly protein FliH/Type III secretion system HrpE domain-containing protein n=1 Tax=Vibrio aquaticus TaxID=2496559 RepID=A0A3S0V3Q1_9VIBR|nr:hypothetical protein [Vibrio aquaticus]RTZ16652.1 hypothetical protein EJ063_07615 [Vibrio aquaticus]